MTDKANTFFEAANPDPDKITEQQVEAQFRNFVEEVRETFASVQTVRNPGAASALVNILYYLQQLEESVDPLGLDITDHVALLDGLCDVSVAGQGLAHILGYDYVGAKNAVDDSNLSKLVDGAVIRTASGKISKPASYVAPNLSTFI